MTQAYGERFADALVSEIKAEMGRRDLSSRALGRLIGKSSQYMSDRLDGGSARTGKRVTLSVWDLGAIAQVLEMKPTDLTFRAHFLALGGDPNAFPLMGPEHDPALRAVPTSPEQSTLDADVVGSSDDYDLVARKADGDRGEDKT